MLGDRDFFLLNGTIRGHTKCSIMRYNQPKNQQFPRIILHNSEKLFAV